MSSNIHLNMIGVGSSKQVNKTLDHAAAHREIYNEIDTVRLDRDRYRRMVDKLYGQMVTPLEPDKFQDESAPTLRRWKIMIGDGVFYEFDGLTRKEAETVWREAWGLDSI